MDIDEASYRQVVEDLQQLYGKRIAPFHLPIRENGQFVGYVNVLQQRAKRWKDNGERGKGRSAGVFQRESWYLQGSIDGGCCGDE